MRRHFSIINIAWQRSMTHRASIWTLRFGEVLEIVILIVMWSYIYTGSTFVAGYTLPEMITYILLGNFITALTRNFLSEMVAREIYDGTLSLFLVKPMTYFQYVFTREIGRITFPLFVSLITQLALLIFYINKLIIQTNPQIILVVGIMTALAFVIEILISYIFGLLAFWMQETFGIHATFNRLKRFLSGGYFPLSLLPPAFITISTALPFAYTFYVPVQLYLGKIPINSGFIGIGVELIWIAILYTIVRLVWYRGIHLYDGVGM